ncbi:MAG: ABC transporter permease [Ruminiclostridium sp.]|nr:ABC transporter permease [Ruminiclostridium sp.]
MNIFIHELKSYGRTTFIWTASLTAFIIMFMLVYPAFSNDVENTRKLFEGFPEGVRKALGLMLDSFFTLLGFYSYIFMYVTLCGAIQAMHMGTSILSKEVRDKTADFLMTKPVSRKKIMTSKLLAVLCSLAITNIICILIAGVMLEVIKNTGYDVKAFLMISATLFFIQLIFAALGVLVSMMVPAIKSVLSVSLGTVFGFFILNMFDSVIDKEAIRYLTPFKFFDFSYIIKNGSYETPFLIVGVVFVIAAVAASYIIYGKRSIHAV